MMMYNPDTSEIAKPSELLSSVKAIMSVLQGLENYGKVTAFIDNKYSWFNASIFVQVYAKWFGIYNEVVCT